MLSVSVRQAKATDDLDVVSVKRAAIEAGAGESYSADQDTTAPAPSSATSTVNR